MAQRANKLRETNWRVGRMESTPITPCSNKKKKQM